MKKENLCVGSRTEMGDHTCKFYLRPVGEIPGGLWSWNVYIDGNVHARGPGSGRKDPVHWYANLLPGAHRVVVREENTLGPTRAESNTLHFTVTDESEIFVDVSFVDGKIDLRTSTERI